MSPVSVPAIGAYIREQREQAKISLRQLAQATGVSNPYLSQIERGLRKPSADILQQLAKGLRISAEALYVQAGFLEDRPEGYGVKEAVLADPELSERQRQMLLEIYDSFRHETTLGAAEAEEGQSAEPGDGRLDPAALTWPELAEGHAAAMPGQPASEQPVPEQPALDQVAAEQAVAEQAVAEHEQAAAEHEQAAAAHEQAVADGAAAAKPAASKAAASKAGSRGQAAPRRAASRRAAPKAAASRRAGSQAAGTAEPQSGASSGNGGRAGRARPSTARTR